VLEPRDQLSAELWRPIAKPSRFINGKKIKNETIDVVYINVGYIVASRRTPLPNKVAKFVMVSSLRLCKAIKALLRRY
jgi:hypothetical protein